MIPLHCNSWGHKLPDDALNRAHPGDAGLDLCAIEDTRICPYECNYVDTGISVIIPEDHVGLLCLRSGWSTRHCCIMPNSPGIIDSSYRGHIIVPVMPIYNQHSFLLSAGTRFAQLVIVPFVNVAVIYHLTPDTWPEKEQTARGEDGFGSSGE